ncbi:hypothetical protein [Bacillus sp. P14.5]|uniref:hypothetical protein n=1 Tax=Bacillus sp. P14.5 TaxID=1983400 RepID=UPI000DE87152|nr:hypothetical protein [Bacillus sp. P14.5]
MGSSSLIFVWVILSILWIVIFLVIVDKFQKSKRNNELKNERRLSELEEENKKTVTIKNRYFESGL